VIHRGGTVLYACAAAHPLLGVPAGASLVGARLLDLFDPAERAEVAIVVDGAAGLAGRTLGGTASLLATTTGRIALEVTAFRAEGESAPLEVLYLCSASGQSRPLSGDELGAEGRNGERTNGVSRQVTVLICDDEARLGALTAGLLSEFGFAPVTVGNGDEALRALGRAEAPVDVLLLDVNLSEGPSAGDVLAGMQTRGYRARVVLTSGLAEEDVSEELLHHPSVVGYVAKPYGVDQLVQSVRTAAARGRS